MGDVVQFHPPTGDPPAPSCGRRPDVGYVVHVWADDAMIGDRCQCGRQRLPESARRFLVTREPGDVIEADERP
jgi:hypothetical protein